MIATQKIGLLLSEALLHQVAQPDLGELGQFEASHVPRFDAWAPHRCVAPPLYSS